jgi:hypothetical protein
MPANPSSPSPARFRSTTPLRMDSSPSFPPTPSHSHPLQKTAPFAPHAPHAPPRRPSQGPPPVCGDSAPPPPPPCSVTARPTRPPPPAVGRPAAQPPRPPGEGARAGPAAVAALEVGPSGAGADPPPPDAEGYAFTGRADVGAGGEAAEEEAGTGSSGGQARVGMASVGGRGRGRPAKRGGAGAAWAAWAVAIPRRSRRLGAGRRTRELAVLADGQVDLTGPDSD